MLLLRALIDFIQFGDRKSLAQSEINGTFSSDVLRWERISSYP